jgi:hypothetical protein
VFQPGTTPETACTRRCCECEAMRSEVYRGVIFNRGGFAPRCWRLVHEELLWVAGADVPAFALASRQLESTSTSAQRPLARRHGTTASPTPESISRALLLHSENEVLKTIFLLHCDSFIIRSTMLTYVCFTQTVQSSSARAALEHASKDDQQTSAHLTATGRCSNAKRRASGMPKTMD